MEDFIRIEHSDGSIEYVHKDYDEIVANTTIQSNAPVPQDLVGLTPEQLQQRVLDDYKNFIREERNRRLFECDWTQGADSPLTEEKKEEWRQYRQALRDLVSNITTPGSVIWPIKPS